MRSLLATAAICVAICLAMAAGAAHAEKRMFIVPSSGDGYGIDTCLASGAACGKAMASAYCHTHKFARAVSYRKVDRDEITGAVPGDSGLLPQRKLHSFRRHRVHALRQIGRIQSQSARQRDRQATCSRALKGAWRR